MACGKWEEIGNKHNLFLMHSLYLTTDQEHAWAATDYERAVKHCVCNKNSYDGYIHLNNMYQLEKFKSVLGT